MNSNKKSNLIQNQNENDYRLVQRQGSQSKSKSSLNKFLKRKPDPKKITHPSLSKKKKQTSQSEYFTTSNLAVDNSSSIYTSSNKQISQSVNQDSNMVGSKSEQALQTTRSQNHLSTNSDKQICPSFLEDPNKVSRTSFFSKAQLVSQSTNAYVSKRQSRNFNPYQKITCKKSKTQYFNLQGLEGESTVQIKGQAFTFNQIGDEEQRKQLQRLVGELDLLYHKNKLIQEQLESHLQQNYLLQTQKNHLLQMLKEKDKTIDRLHDESSSNATVKYEKVQILKEQLQLMKDKHEQQVKMNALLKQQNSSLLHQIDLKNDQLMIVYDQYTDLQAKYKKQSQQFIQQRERMKKQIQAIRQQIRKQEVVDFHSLQVDKWKESLFKQQEEIKYLQIQNQCLMVSREELMRCEAENRKLRDQRDYFKKKIMENIRKNNKRNRQDFSRSDNSLTVLQLSEMST